MVTDSMLTLGRKLLPSFAVIGLFEALFMPCLFFCVARLPGALIPVLSQSIIVWNFLLSVMLLKKRCATLSSLATIPIQALMLLLQMCRQVACSSKEQLPTEAKL